VAQQAPQYTMTMQDKYRHNPGYGGMDASLSLTGTIKTQWEAFPGAPKYQSVTAHMPLYIANGGVGIQFFNDAIGVENSMGFLASYNYVYETNVGLFSLGLGLGMVQKRLDGSLLRTLDGVYEGFTIIHNDPLLSSVQGSGIGPTTSFGLYFANEYMEAGIAVDQFLGNTITLNNEVETSFALRRTFNAFVEYIYPVNEEIQIYPAVFAKTDGIQLQLDLSGRIDYRDIYFGGLVFRGYSAQTIDAVAMFVGARLSNKLSISYAYDITLSDLRNYNDGTHEILVHYNLGKPIGVGRPERIIYNPRY
jgi:type IX secretion system PorP/SprF family membrane protein